jgi:transcriptional regulator with XRE-family HTH domain
VADEDNGVPDPEELSVGQRLRAMRRAHGLSAKEVARRAEVSPAYLSRLENDKVSPTVTTLTRVVQAMGESVARLFGGAAGGPVVRRKDRRIVRNRGVDDYILTPPQSTQLQVLETIIQGGSGSGRAPYTHAGDEECVLVLDGALHVWLDGVRYELLGGDAITFPCSTPHRWENPGTSDARLLWIVTPASY